MSRVRDVPLSWHDSAERYAPPLEGLSRLAGNFQPRRSTRTNAGRLRITDVPCFFAIRIVRPEEWCRFA